MSNIIVASIILGLSIGIMIGFFIGITKSEIITKEVTISKRMERCEIKGGRYRFWYSDISDRYIEKCLVIQDEIFTY